MSEILVNTIKKADGTGSITVPANTGTLVDTSGADFTGNVSTTGTLGVGVSSPQEHLSIDVALNDTEGLGLEYNGETKGGIKLNPSGGEVRVGSLNSTGTYNTTLYSNNSERMRITSDGDVFINTTSAVADTQAVFAVDGSVGFQSQGRPCLTVNRQTDNGNAIELKRGGATVGKIQVTTTSTSYVTSSDYRLKENVVDMTGAINRVKSLSPKRFNFIADTDDTTVDGFLAHEAATVVPEAVTGTHNEVDDDGNPEYQGIDQSKLVPLLTGALQEAIAKIETLEAKVAVLESN